MNTYTFTTGIVTELISVDIEDTEQFTIGRSLDSVRYSLFCIRNMLLWRLNEVFTSYQDRFYHQYEVDIDEVVESSTVEDEIGRTIKRHVVRIVSPMVIDTEALSQIQGIIDDYLASNVANRLYVGRKLSREALRAIKVWNYHLTVEDPDSLHLIDTRNIRAYRLLIDPETNNETSTLCTRKLPYINYIEDDGIWIDLSCLINYKQVYEVLKNM